jgi:hypothetical protein
MRRSERAGSNRSDEPFELKGRALAEAFRSRKEGLSFSVEPLPDFVEESLAALGPRSRKDVEIFRNLLTIKVPVEHLLQEVSKLSGASGTEVDTALSRVCSAWVDKVPQGTIETRMPIAHAVGRLVDLWVSHRDANLSVEQRRAIPANRATREGFVTNDPTARALYNALSRLNAPAMLAANARTQRLIERYGIVTRIGQDTFKVFFDTLFVFDPERANSVKSTSDQFIPYLWSRLEARWIERQARVEDRAARAYRDKEGGFTDIASSLEDKGARGFTTSIEQREEFEWTLKALKEAVTKGIVRADDYDAVLRYYGLATGTGGVGEAEGWSASTKMKAQRGIERFKRYLRTQENGGQSEQELSFEPDRQDGLRREEQARRAALHEVHLKRAARRAARARF